MEPLARYVRGLGAKHRFWIEGPHPAGLDEGAGAAIMSWFQQHNS
jgi:hypothetical protein